MWPRNPKVTPAALQRRQSSLGFGTVEALVIRIAFGGTLLWYNDNNKPPKPYLNIKAFALELSIGIFPGDVGKTLAVTASAHAP